MASFWQLFGDNDIFQQYGIPMNPTDATSIPGMDERQRSQNDTSPHPQAATGSELMSYQGVQQPIDFTDFLNLDENELAMNAPGSLATDS